MGCDIHCYIEYKEPDREHWSGFGNRINPGRNYGLFGAMAGVRCDLPHIEPRGVPEEIAYECSGDYWIYISSESAEGDGTCSEEKAKSCIQYGSVLKKSDAPIVGNFVSDPDSHTHSWLTADEFELAIATYLKDGGFQIGTLRLEGPTQEALANPTMEQTWTLRALTEYWAILAAMRCFEAQGKKSRLVFWFDN